LSMNDVAREVLADTTLHVEVQEHSQ
jgi:hypothetical protein